MKCESCGCSGNLECGAKPISDKHWCALNPVLICYCCAELGKEKNMARWKKKTSTKYTTKIKL